jgi:hypothetical protein
MFTERARSRTLSLISLVPGRASPRNSQLGISPGDMADAVPPSKSQTESAGIIMRQPPGSSKDNTVSGSNSCPLRSRLFDRKFVYHGFTPCVST